MAVCFYFCTIFLVLLSMSQGSNNTNSVNDPMDCENVEIVRRSEWGARPPKSGAPLQTPVKHAFVYHTVGETCHDLTSCRIVMKSIQDLHMDTNGWPDVAYSFVVGNDGRVYEGRGWTSIESAVPKYNDKSIGAAFMGNYMLEYPNVFMVRAAYNLFGCGLKKGYFTSDYQVHGHRDASCTFSPGNKLYDIIKKWPRFVGRPLEFYTC